MNRPPDTIRAFVALPAGPELLEALLRLQQQLAGRMPVKAVRWSRRDQLHLTLKFLGNVPTNRVAELTAALRSAVVGFAPMRLRVEGTGAFPDFLRPRVVWAGVTGELDQLALLQRRVETATAPFGDHQEARSFQPHLTLGRVTATGHAAREAGLALEAMRVGVVGEWPANEVRLIRSQLAAAGASYSDLARLPLTRADAGFRPRTDVS